MVSTEWRVQRSVRKMSTAALYVKKSRHSMFETILHGWFAGISPASLPVWPYSQHWVFESSAILGVVLVALLILSVVDPNF